MKKPQKNNFPDSLLNLGKFYSEGIACEKDITKSIQYLKRAAELNNSEAYFTLGCIYYEGNDVTRDYDKAKYYFEQASFLKNSDALLNLGIIHYKGLSRETNIKRAIEYFILAFELKNLNSYFYLGLVYEKGIGIEINTMKSIENYAKCANFYDFKYEKDILKGYKEQTKRNNFYYIANNDLGLKYLTDKEVFDLNLGEKYLKEAGCSNYPYGKCNYGLFCQLYKKDNSKAEHFFKEASINGGSFSL